MQETRVRPPPDPPESGVTVFEQVTVENDEQLLSMLRQYKRLRTYPDARESGQRVLHSRLEILFARGAVKVVERDANSVVWTV